MRATKAAVVAAVLGVGAAVAPPDDLMPRLLGQGQVELPVKPVPMGDYEVVQNWPRPLPDTFSPGRSAAWNGNRSAFR